MGPLRWFLFVYVLGGITFIPLVIILVLAYGYYTLPPAAERSFTANNDPSELTRPEDDKLILKTGTDDLAEKFHRKHDSDVAAGYFAVCREFVPGGVNGKPPEKLTPAGENITTESPSVYQSMYRSIFDRSQKPTIEPNKENGAKNVKRTNNVFYVVLRHGHLMLYDDIQQLEVRFVISLDYHDVDLYAGGELIPEGELYIKRHAIRLKRKPLEVGDKAGSQPFYLFGESQSAKEDFYFALLKNQEGSDGELPVVQEFDVNDIVTLVQKLHSSEEQLQTRWLNAMIGRVFLAMYKTPELEQFIRSKLTKKISRVKKPTFITKLALEKIVMGKSAPFFTNPRLKDLTVNGDCMVEADMDYSGNFRIEIAATARLDLGSRFKAREVDMLLAVTVKKIQGHVLGRIKPPPSNRLWFTFEKVPQMDLVVEPIVSSRQITFGMILRQIESRIREVVVESICFPFWDDIPFFDTINERYRGGIWKREPVQTTHVEIKNEDTDYEIGSPESGARTPVELEKVKEERASSMPVLADMKKTRRKGQDKKSVSSLSEVLNRGEDTESVSSPNAPKFFRSTSSTTGVKPSGTTNHADGDASTNEAETPQNRDRAASYLKDITQKPFTVSPSGSISGTPPNEPSLISLGQEFAPSTASIASGASGESQKGMEEPNSFLNTPTSPISDQNSAPGSLSRTNTDSRPGSVQDEAKNASRFAQAAKSLTNTDRKQAIASINAATQAAQKWGWGVLARNRQKEAQAAAEKAKSQNGATSMPMGRGRPLPPPGVPLPPPERSNTATSTFSLKRKPVPPPLLPKRPPAPESIESNSPRTGTRPPLPERRQRQTSLQKLEDKGDEVFVIEAPTESAPTSPAAHEHHNEFFGHNDVAKPTLPARSGTVLDYVGPVTPFESSHDPEISSHDDNDEESVPAPSHELLKHSSASVEATDSPEAPTFVGNEIRTEEAGPSIDQEPESTKSFHKLSNDDQSVRSEDSKDENVDNRITDGGKSVQGL